MSEKMQPMTREQLVKRVAYFRDRCYHWHQVAKKWRKNFHYMANEAKLAYEDKQNADRLAASRLELLSMLEWTIDVETGLRFCPRCGEWEENGHDDDCELAKELADD